MTGKEWETLALELLKLKYGSHNVIPIPDQHLGDAGLECYTTDGIAYQMYCPSDLFNKKELYTHQRDKMTQDISKFINNAAQLNQLIYETKIRRWVLLVPDHFNKELVIHANKKSKAVRDADLSYVDSSEFRVLIEQESDFQSEKALLVEQGILELKIDYEEASDAETEEFFKTNNDQSARITKKLLKLSIVNEQTEPELRYSLVKEYIDAENLLQKLKEEHPQYWETVNTIKRKREKSLKLETATLDENTTIPKEIETIKATLNSKTNLHEDNTEKIAWGAVTDWLIRCPLDFVE